MAQRKRQSREVEAAMSELRGAAASQAVRANPGDGVALLREEALSEVAKLAGGQCGREIGVRREGLP